MPAQKSCRCAGADTLIFACSGAADVGEIADRAARKLKREGVGKMYCLTGIGGRIPSMVKIAKAAGAILAIDGCAQACAKHCLEQAGVKDFAHLQLGEIGMDKGLSPVTGKVVVHAAKAAKDMLAH